jgi:hypothetical protein
MPGKNKAKQGLMTLAALMLAAAGASAISLGAGPSVLDFGRLLRGGYSEGVITVSTSGGEDLVCTVEASGQMGDWLAVDKKAFTLPANGRITLKATLNPPKDAANGRYEGTIHIRAAPTNTQNDTGLTVGAGIKIRTTAEITDKQVISFKIHSSSATDTETGYPIRLAVTLKNTGNARAKPETLVEVYDLGGTQRTTYTQTMPEINPTAEYTGALDIPSQGMDAGRYTARLTIDNDEQNLTFTLLEKGTLALKGVLKTLTLNKIWAETGEIVKITGDVENTGRLPIEGAKLTIEVSAIDERTQTEDIIKVFNGEENLEIPTGETREFTAYFSPINPGRYRITGAIAYSGKKTQAKSTILNVAERPTNSLPYLMAAAILTIALAYWITRRKDDGRTIRFKKRWSNYLQIK